MTIHISKKVRRRHLRSNSILVVWGNDVLFMSHAIGNVDGYYVNKKYGFRVKSLIH